MSYLELNISYLEFNISYCEFNISYLQFNILSKILGRYNCKFIKIYDYNDQAVFFGLCTVISLRQGYITTLKYLSTPNTNQIEEVPLHGKLACTLCMNP